VKSATASEDLSSCLIHYSNQDCQGQGNQFVDSLVMQACVTAAHSQDPGDPSVLVIMCGAPISQLPPSWHLMPPLTPGVMKNINFVYPQNSKDLLEYLNSLHQGIYPKTIIVTDLDKIVEKFSSSSSNLSCNSQFCQNFAKISAILNDFGTFFSSEISAPLCLQVFTRLESPLLSMLKQKLKFWYCEEWQLKPWQLTCLSSSKQQIIKFYLKDNQYYLEEIVIE